MFLNIIYIKLLYTAKMSTKRFFVFKKLLRHLLKYRHFLLVKKCLSFNLALNFPENFPRPLQICKFCGFVSVGFLQIRQIVDFANFGCFQLCAAGGYDRGDLASLYLTMDKKTARNPGPLCRVPTNSDSQATCYHNIFFCYIPTQFQPALTALHSI